MHAASQSQDSSVDASSVLPLVAMSLPRVGALFRVGSPDVEIIWGKEQDALFGIRRDRHQIFAEPGAGEKGSPGTIDRSEGSGRFVQRYAQSFKVAPIHRPARPLTL